MIAPARTAAYHALRRIHAERTTLPHALARMRPTLDDERDRGLADELVVGIERWRAMLDAVIAHYATRPLARMDPEVLDVLRLGAYQLLRLDRVPPSAVVHDAVELVRAVGKRSAASLVNAVLRAISRARHQPPVPPAPDPATLAPADKPERWSAETRNSALAYLSVTQSHPRWLVDRWLTRHGWPATLAWAQFNNQPAPMTLRVNRLRIEADALAGRLSEHGVRAVRAAYAPDALEVRAGNPLHTPLAESGLFVLQEEASQLVGLLLDARPGMWVLDGCAAPGGKTLTLTAAMQNIGCLVAADLRHARMRLLEHTVRQAGASCARLVQLDLQAPLPFRRQFDRILVDAPCTGLGMLRRDPDIRWRREETDLSRYQAQQLGLLDHAAEAVRPGGRLVYATCSSEPEENEHVARAFGSAHPAFDPVDLTETLARYGPHLASLVDGRGHFRTLPHRHGLDAFFGAAFERRSAG